MYNIIFKTLAIILFSISFTACQSAMSVFDKSDTQYERGLQHTKVKSIIYKNETKAIINATYLNSINAKKWDKESQNFLVGIYISEDNEKENTKFINNSRYTLTMNNRAINTHTLFTDDYKLNKNIPLKNPWAKYYLVSFSKKIDDNKTLLLKYTNPNFGEVILPFEKE